MRTTKANMIYLPIFNAEIRQGVSNLVSKSFTNVAFLQRGQGKQDVPLLPIRIDEVGIDPQKRRVRSRSPAIERVMNLTPRKSKYLRHRADCSTVLIIEHPSQRPTRWYLRLLENKVVV